MIRRLRSLFLGRLLREKLLLIAFLALGVLWWLSAAAARTTAFAREQRATTSALNEQGMYLSNRSLIEEAAQKAAGQFDRTKTLDGVRLVSAINQAAAEAGLRDKYRTSLVGAPQSNGQFAINAASCDVANAPYDSIQKFYQLLQQRAPYLGIDQFVLTANRTNPSQLSLRVRVQSFEIAH